MGGPRTDHLPAVRLLGSIARRRETDDATAGGVDGPKLGTSLGRVGDCYGSADRQGLWTSSPQRRSLPVTRPIDLGALPTEKTEKKYFLDGTHSYEGAARPRTASLRGATPIG